MAQDGPGVESRDPGAENKSVTARTFISSAEPRAEASRQSAFAAGHLQDSADIFGVESVKTGAQELRWSGELS